MGGSTERWRPRSGTSRATRTSSAGWGDDLAIDRTIAGGFDGRGDRLDRRRVLRSSSPFRVARRVPTAGVTIVGCATHAPPARAAHAHDGRPARRRRQPRRATRGAHRVGDLDLRTLRLRPRRRRARGGSSRPRAPCWPHHRAPTAPSVSSTATPRCAVVPARLRRGCAWHAVGEVTRPASCSGNASTRNGARPASPDSDGTPFFTVVHDGHSGHARRVRVLLREERVAARTAQQRARACMELHATSVGGRGRPLGVPPEHRSGRGRCGPTTGPSTSRSAGDSHDPAGASRCVQLTDHLWIRVVDVAAALVGPHLRRRRRGRARARRPVPAVERRHLAGGRAARGCAVRAAPTDDARPRARPRADLGALYLGGVSAVHCSPASGRVEERTSRRGRTRRPLLRRSTPPPGAPPTSDPPLSRATARQQTPVMSRV